MINSTFEELRLSGNLPSPSGVGMRILELTRTDDYDTDEIGATIRGDSALTGRILKLANTAQTAGVEPVTTVSDGIMRLGTRTVRDLALAFSLISERRAGTCTAFDYDRYWSKSLARAVSAQEICRLTERAKPEEGYITGLLGEIGQLAMASVFPEPYAEILTDAEPGTSSSSLLQVESVRFDINHKEIGSCILRDWGLPDSFAEAIEVLACSSIESSADADQEGLGGVLCLAEILAEAFTLPEDAPLASWRALHEGLGQLAEPLGLETPEAVAAFARKCAKEWHEWGDSLSIETTSTNFEETRSRARKAFEAPAGAQPSKPKPKKAQRRAQEVKPEMIQDRRVRILCADDDPVVLRMLTSYLNGQGFEVIGAENGRKAMRIALEKLPDIVIADWGMPELDGVELCGALRRNDAGRQMYFLLLTGTDEENKIVEAFDAGVDDYIVKPFIPRLLSARIKGGLRLTRLQQKVDEDKRTMLRQVAEMGVLTRKLRAVSLTDVLTELPNRRYAMKRLDTEWSSASRTGRPLSLMMMDIDHFKKVNDNFGHDVGDIVLRETGQLVRRCLRQADEVCRIGGEEFLVICPNTGTEDCAVVAERIRKRVAENIINGGNFNRNVTLSIGIGTRETAHESVAELMKTADEGVYEAKDSGRNRVVVKSTSSDSKKESA